MTSQDDTPKGELILYQTEDGRTRIDCRFEGETIWLAQALRAELFQTTLQNINLHLQNIYEEGEFDPGATIKSYLMVRQEGTRQVRRPVQQLLAGRDPRRRVPRPQPSRHAVPQVGQRAAVRVPGQGPSAAA